MKTVKQKKLTGKVTERHLEQVIEVTLLKADVKEYRREWAKNKAETRSTLGDSDSDEPEEVDFDRTIREEAEATSLDSRREFLIKFLNTKLIQVKDI